MCDSLPSAIKVSSYRFNSFVLKTEQSDFVMYSFVRLTAVKNFFIQSLIEKFVTLRIEALDKDYSGEIIIRGKHFFSSIPSFLAGFLLLGDVVRSLCDFCDFFVAEVVVGLVLRVLRPAGRRLRVALAVHPFLLAARVWKSAHGLMIN